MVWGGGSDIDISGYNKFFKAFTFLYRPLFYDAKNIQMVASSIENAIYLVLTIMMLTPRFLKFILKQKSPLIRFCVFYTMIGTIIFSNASTNLGTATRLKTMVIITFLLLFLIIMAKRKEIVAGTPVHLEKYLSRPQTPGTLPPG